MKEIRGRSHHKTREREMTKMKEILMDFVVPRGCEVDTHFVRFLIFSCLRVLDSLARVMDEKMKHSRVCMCVV